jgi:hypothetical protein
MKLMTAYGTADLGPWLEQPERDATQQMDESWSAPTASKTLGSSPEASLLKLQTELHQNARKEFWIVVVLWAASWGAVPLVCV